MRLRKLQDRKGQTMVEYIIIVVVIAISTLVIFGIFGDTIRKKLSGATSALDDEKGGLAQAEAGGEAAEFLKKLDETGESN
jgi:Flp pilus assembly pilin Flp